MQPTVKVLAGPTASGKSALAIAWAQAFDAEIINADSQAVYRHFDIGTAKPTPAELARVPHHLVSCIEPNQEFSAAHFARAADEVIAGIRARGKQVIVVGGTGLYLRALLHGLVEAPPRNESVRAELEARAETLGNANLWAELNASDPETAAKLPVGDRVRIVRALELLRTTGQKPSDLRARHAFAGARYSFDLRVLNPARESLYAAINRRTQAMFDAGLVDEARALIEQGFGDSAPMKAVGYEEARRVLSGEWSSEHAVEQVAMRTRHYAKRQWTWFRKEPGAVFVEPPFNVETLF